MTLVAFDIVSVGILSNRGLRCISKASVTRTFRSRMPSSSFTSGMVKPFNTENSYKFTDGTLGALLSDSGFEIQYAWKDAREWYALTLSLRHEQD